ncbi:hypothetical protein JCM3766R1_002855 [Sporobolomyces carnicolor]
MVAVVGDFFHAQQVFNSDNFACSAGQTIAAYCSKAQDTCCAVCPNAPITGPGTLIVMTLGTFVNLLFVLWYQSEAPYNLAYQIVATDSAAFGLVNRLFQPEFPLSQFHYAFVPLAIMSCIPLAFAACTNDYASYHSHTPNALAALQRAALSRKMSNEPQDVGLLPHADRDGHPHRDRTTSHSLTPSRFRRSPTRSPSPVRGRTPVNHGGYSATNKSSKRPQGVHNLIDEFDIPRKYLIKTAWGFYTVHIPLWFILFVYLYFFHSKYNQAQCAVEFPPIRTLHFVLAGLVFSWWLFGLFVYVCFTAVIFSKKKPKRDLLESIGAIFHLTSPSKEAGMRHRLAPGFDSRSGVKHHLFPKTLHSTHPMLTARARARSIARWGLSIGVFVIWLVEYMAIYFNAVHSFVLIGTNGFDFGQVVAVVSIGVPAFLIMRAQLDYNSYWSDARKVWDDEDAEKEHTEQTKKELSGERLENFPELEDSSSYKGLLPHIPQRRNSSRSSRPSSSRRQSVASGGEEVHPLIDQGNSAWSRFGDPTRRRRS